MLKTLSTPKFWNELKQRILEITRPVRRKFWVYDRVRGRIEKSAYWKRACDPKLDVEMGRRMGYGDL